MVWPAVIAAAGAVASSVLSNNANSAASRETNDWNEYMYRNRYQFQVEDMKKAGLNPALSYNYSAPSAASGAQARQSFSNAGGAAVDAYLRSSATAAQVKNLEADSNLKNAQADAARNTTPSRDDFNEQFLARTADIWTRKHNTLVDSALKEKEIEKIGSEINSIRQSIIESRSRISLNASSSAHQLASAGLANAQSVEVQSLLPSRMAESVARGSLTSVQAEYAARTADALIQQHLASASASRSQSRLMDLSAIASSLAGAGFIARGGKVAKPVVDRLSRSKLGRDILYFIRTGRTGVR